MTDPGWLDPSGWRPYLLQMSVLPEQRGIPFHEWQRSQPLCTRAELMAWIAANDPETLLKLKALKKKKR